MRSIPFLLFVALTPLSAFAQGTPECALETTLSQAAQVLLTQKGGLDAQIIVAKVRVAGSDIVSVRALWQEHGDLKSLRRWLKTFREQADAPLVCGIAATSNLSLTIAAARGGGLHPLGTNARLVKGWLAGGFSQPHLVLIDAKGLMVQVPATPTELAKGVTVPATLEKPILVQLVARGRGGPRPVAERIIAGSGQTEDETQIGTRGAVLLPQERDPNQHLKRIRSAWGAPALRENSLLARVATSHALAICQTGRIAHELGPGDNPESRLARAGIRARGVGEALAHGESVYASMEALQKSPSHLMTMVDRRFTDAGIGVAHDRDGKPCVVVLLAIWPRMVGVTAP
jgi:hypothetical protein